MKIPITERYRQTQLIVEGPELLELGIAFRRVAQGLPDRVQIGGIQILLFRKRFVFADDVDLFRDRRRFRIQFGPHRFILNDLSDDPAAHLRPDLLRLRRIVHMIHHHQDHPAHQQIEKRIETVPPGSQNARHLLFVGCPRRRGRSAS